MTCNKTKLVSENGSLQSLCNSQSLIEKMQEIDVPGVVEALTTAKSVVIVPGYGLAVAGAQVT